MTFLDAIQSGSAHYFDQFKFARVWRVGEHLYGVQADMTAFNYAGRHELAQVIRLLRFMGYPLDCGWHRDEQ